MDQSVLAAVVVPSLLGVAASAQPLIAVDTPGNSIYRVDPPDGWSLSQPVSFLVDPRVIITGLAGNIDTGALYGISWQDQAIFRINPHSGKLTRISAPVFTGFAHGLAYDSNRDRLLVSNNEGEIWTYDVTTRAASLLGSLPFKFDVEGLAYDAVTDSLYGLKEGNLQEIIRIDLGDFTKTQVIALGDGLWSGLVFDPTTGHLLATRVNRDGYVRVDPATGQAVDVGEFGFQDWAPHGLAFIPAPGPAAAIAVAVLSSATRRRRRRS